MNTTSAQQPIVEVKCPQCQTTVPWTAESSYRPFCSKRCQLIDFGDWANERHSIPAVEPPEDFSLDALEDRLDED